MRQLKDWPGVRVFYVARARGVILGMLAVVLGVGYLGRFLALPLVTRPEFTDFNEIWTAVVTLAGGGDPYSVFLAHSHYDFAVAYLYPPPMVWALQVLLPLGRENAALLAVVGLEVCLVGFLVVMARALRPGKQELLAWVILTLVFDPVAANLLAGQFNLLLLLLSGLALGAYMRGDRVGGGFAWGLGEALKPLQPGVGLVLLWGRRWKMVLAAAVGAVVWLLLPGWSLLWEFVSKVLPRLGGGGLAANGAPAGALARAFDPASFYDGAALSGWEGKLWLVVAAGVLMISWWALGRRPRASQMGRASEVALGVAVSPLLLSVANNWHLVLLLLPILVLVRLGLVRRDGWLLAAALVAWALMGPAWALFQAVLTNAYGGSLVAAGSVWWMRVWAECEMLGMLVLWAGCLRAVRVVGAAGALYEPAFGGEGQASVGVG